MTTRTPTSPEERIAVEALGRCAMIPGSWDKRFNRQLSPDQLSDKERPQVWRMFIKYRRQIAHPRKAELLELAARLSAPDFRKQQALERERAKYEDAFVEKKL